MKHLSVIYDEENDTLIYDRTLKDGMGETYGIEFVKVWVCQMNLWKIYIRLEEKYIPKIYLY